MDFFLISRWKHVQTATMDMLVDPKQWHLLQEEKMKVNYFIQVSLNVNMLASYLYS